MSRFHIGMDVWIAWDTPQGTPIPEARRFLCRFGVLVSGPYAPGEKAPGAIRPCYLKAWMVETKIGPAVVAERLLRPFEPPAREVDIESVLELTE